jgi:hypothetical protein
MADNKLLFDLDQISIRNRKHELENKEYRQCILAEYDTIDHLYENNDDLSNHIPKIAIDKDKVVVSCSCGKEISNFLRVGVSKNTIATLRKHIGGLSKNPQYIQHALEEYGMLEKIEKNKKIENKKIKDVGNTLLHWSSDYGNNSKSISYSVTRNICKRRVKRSGAKRHD